MLYAALEINRCNTLLFLAKVGHLVISDVTKKGWTKNVSICCLSSKIFLLTVPSRYFFCGSFVLFMSCVCHAFASVLCRFVVT